MQASVARRICRSELWNISPTWTGWQFMFASTLAVQPAGLATLEALDQKAYDRLEALGARLEAGLARAITAAGVPGVVQRVGSMFTLFFHDGPVRNFREASRSNTKRFARFHMGLLERGIYWPPSQFEAAFISLAHTDADLDATIEAASGALRDAS
jgi:glutamate-1-semialdehyde 2,1-aminomutase